MCGRYYRRADKQRIAEYFSAHPTYNVAPTTFQPVIRNSRDRAERELLLMRWSLVPFFTKRALLHYSTSTPSSSRPSQPSKSKSRLRRRRARASRRPSQPQLRR